MSKIKRFKMPIRLLLTISTVLLFTYGSAHAGDIHDAASWGSLEEISHLLSMGVGINAKDSGGNAPLHLAASRDRLDVARYLLAKGAEADARNSSGYTPLYNAAWTGRYEIAKLLIANGADVNAKDNQGNTPLNVAAREGRMEVVELLVLKGADVKAKVGRDYTALHRIAARGHLEMTRLLIAKGADVNAKDSNGFTPLHNASSGNHLEVASLLLSKQAGINARNAEGYTPLNQAVAGGHLEMAELLILYGAKVNTKTTGRGFTPLHMAAWAGYLEISDLLISEEADIDVRDGDGRTPLDWAATGFKKDTIRLLISEGAGVNTRDNDHNTPLHHIAKKRYESSFQSVAWLLILNGADVDAKNKSGDTPKSLSPTYPIVMTEYSLEYCKAAEAAQYGGFHGGFQTEPGDRNLRLALQYYAKCLALSPEARFWLSREDLRSEILKIVYDDKILPPAFPEKAERFMERARAAIKAARDRTGLLEASQEIHQALIVAPWFAEGYFYHAAILEKAGKYDSAMNSLTLYMVAKPDAIKAKSLAYEINSKIQ